ncbi:hypothetical protein KUV89_03720 [Marinobacter hydrocarbonoclasticus]|nr:hypothetical protein [Marinobacter nauticus]
MNTLVSLVLLVTIVAICRPIGTTVRLPLLLLVGAVLGQAVSLLRIESGWNAHLLVSGIVYVVLPVLIWELAARLPLRRLKPSRLRILKQSAVTFLLMLAGVSAALFIGIDHSGFPLLSAVVAATLLATTDPGFAAPFLQRHPRVHAWLEGEAALIEPLALVLLTTLLGLETLANWSWSTGGAKLGLTLLTAVLCAGAGVLIWRWAGGAQWGALGTGIWLWWLYWISDDLLKAPGLVVVLMAVFWLKHRHRAVVPCGNLSVALADALVLVLGFSLTLSMFTERYWAMGLGILAAVLIRTLSLLPWLMAASLPITKAERPFWLLAPSRGPITLALVLALPTDLPAWWTVQSLCYGVILFDLLVQGSLLGMLSRR